MNLLAVPWATTGPAPDQPTLVFASRFDSHRSLRSAGRLLRLSGRVRGAALRADGCYGAGLLARPLLGSYYTLSRWRDEAALAAFAHNGLHRDAVRAMRAAGEVDGVLISWWEPPQRPRPSWAEVIARTAASPTGAYRGPADMGEAAGHRA